MTPQVAAVAVFALMMGASTFWLHRTGQRRLRRLNARVGGLRRAVVSAGEALTASLAETRKLAQQRPLASPRPVGATAPVCSGVHWVSRTVELAPGQSLGFEVGPTRTPAIFVEMIRMDVRAKAFPSVHQRVELLTLEINDQPQFDWSRPRSCSYSRDQRNEEYGVSSDVFAAPPGHAVPVELSSAVTTTNWMQALGVVARNDNPTPVLLTVDLFGEATDAQVQNDPPPTSAQMKWLWHHSTWTREDLAYADTSLGSLPTEVKVGVTLPDGRTGSATGAALGDVAMEAFVEALRRDVSEAAEDDG